MHLVNVRGLLNIPNVLVVSKRFRAKINIQKPKKTFYERAIIEAVCAPLYSKKSLVEECCKAQEKHLKVDSQRKEPHPYLTILARELFERLDASKMIILFHVHSHKAEEMFDTTVAFHKLNIRYASYPKDIFNAATSGTKFITLQPFFATEYAKTSFVYSSEIKVAEALNIAKKCRYITAMAGIIEGRLISKDQLDEYAKFPDIQHMRAQFATDLHSVCSSIFNKLQGQQTQFYFLLETRAKILKESIATNTKMHNNAGKTPTV